MPGRTDAPSLLVALTLAVSACEPPTDPIDQPPRRLVIHAVLDNGTNGQLVKVQYLDSQFGHSLRTVDGANVTITTPTGQEFPATRLLPDGDYAVIGLGLGGAADLVPGGTYTLRVTTPAGEVATGTTTVPQRNTFSNTIQISNFDRDRDTLRLSWARVPLAARYQATFESTIDLGGGFGTLIQRHSIFTDTSLTLAGTARTLDNEAVFPRGALTLIVVSAVDDNYFTYYHPTVDPFAGSPPSRLTGALGVFGSLVHVQSVVVFVND